MFLKCSTAIIIAALTGALLLGLRQQRFETMHEMAKTHSAINSTRQTMWNLQTRVAGSIEPTRLQDAITKANLPFETFTPSAPVQPQLVANQKNLGLNLLRSTPSDIDLADGRPTGSDLPGNNTALTSNVITPATRPGSAASPASSNSRPASKPASASPAKPAPTKKPASTVKITPASTNRKNVPADRNTRNASPIRLTSLRQNSR